MVEKPLGPPAKPQRSTADLRLGRQSIPGAVYFVTFCTANRAITFDSASHVAAGHSATNEIVACRDAEILAATLMSDHVHLLFRLGDQLSLDRVIAKWKFRVRRLLPGVAWHPNYFEHRLRDHEDAERYAWYIFMNPYRAGLVATDECWPGWWPKPSMHWRFLDLAREGPRPPPEWLGEFETRTRGLIVGEDTVPLP